MQMLALFVNSEEGCISQKIADNYSILSCYKSGLFVPKSFVTEQIKENLKAYLYINALILS